MKKRSRQDVHQQQLPYFSNCLHYSRTSILNYQHIFMNKKKKTSSIIVIPTSNWVPSTSDSPAIWLTLSDSQRMDTHWTHKKHTLRHAQKNGLYKIVVSNSRHATGRASPHTPHHSHDSPVYIIYVKQCDAATWWSEKEAGLCWFCGVRTMDDTCQSTGILI